MTGNACMYDVTMWCMHLTTVALEMQP